MVEGLLATAEERRRHPRDDILSELVQLRPQGQDLLSDDQLISVLWNLIGGGLDTTTSLTSLALYHLNGRPDLRQRLIEDRDLLTPATEEYLRYFSVSETLTRTVTADTELVGQPLHRGEYLMISWLSANFDEKVFDRPEEVILDRAPNPHLAFGVGAHRCIGMHLARTLFQVMMDQLLDRVPDYSISGETQFYQDTPLLNGVVKMPVAFTPGPRRGPAERPF
jgi:cytochrome P450